MFTGNVYDIEKNINEFLKWIDKHGHEINCTQTSYGGTVYIFYEINEFAEETEYDN
jgi:hypothetical protein